jgi:hypothetical protein
MCASANVLWSGDVTADNMEWYFVECSHRQLWWPRDSMPQGGLELEVEKRGDLRRQAKVIATLNFDQEALSHVERRRLTRVGFKASRRGWQTHNRPTSGPTWQC